MAKRRSPKAPRVVPPRGENGRFLSKDDIAARNRELAERARELAFMTPEQRMRRAYSEAQREAIKQEKKERHARARENPEAYRNAPKQNEDKTHNDLRALRLGNIPPPTEVRHHGSFTEYIWHWQGEHARQAAQELLLQFRLQNIDGKAYMAVGFGVGKDAEWYGTPHGSLDVVWFAADNLGGKKSAKHVTQPEDGRRLRAEVKLTSQTKQPKWESTDEAGNVSHGKRGKRATKQKRHGGKKRKATPRNNRGRKRNTRSKAAPKRRR